MDSRIAVGHHGRSTHNTPRQSIFTALVSIFVTGIFPLAASAQISGVQVDYRTPQYEQAAKALAESAAAHAGPRAAGEQMTTAEKAEVNARQVIVGRFPLAAKSDSIAAQGAHWLQGGGVTVASNGAARAGVTLLRLNLGDPAYTWSLPLAFAVGASGQALSGKPLDDLRAELLDEVGGILNVGFRRNDLNIHEWGQYTKLHWSYDVAMKVIHAPDTGTTPVPKAAPLQTDGFPLTTGALGLGVYFQTGAWNPDDPKNVGIAWVHLQGRAEFVGRDKLQRALGSGVGGTLGIASASGGVSVKNYVNATASVSWELLNSARGFGGPVIRTGFEFTP